MSQAKLRGGLFGCGMISEFHLRGCQRIPEVEIVALGDRMIERSEARRTEFAPAARTYNDLRALLAAEQLDFIDILTPPALHHQHCRLAAEFGVHIICQKPLCDELQEARALVAALRDYPQLFAVHENHRYRPWFQRVLALYAQGFFGPLHLVRLEHLNATAPAEAYKAASARGILLEYGTHLVDMMIALLGTPARVYARAHRVNQQVQGESLVHAVYEYAQTTAQIDVGWKQAGLLQGSAVILGERGEAYYEGTMTRGESGRFRLVQDGKVILDEVRSPHDDYVESFYRFERECADAMLSDSQVAQTGAEHLKALAATFAAYQSVDEARIVVLS